MADNPKYNPNDKMSTQPKQILVGDFCYDLALAREDVVDELRKKSQSVCNPSTRPVKDSSNASVHFVFPDAEHPTVAVDQQIEAIPRSLAKIFTYLGQLVPSSSPPRFVAVPLFTTEAKAAEKSAAQARLLTISLDSSGECFTTAEYFGETYCVPLRNTDNTKRVFTVLTELTTLSTSISDVPTSLTVRVTP
jgi:hypothetical protein